MTMPTGRRIHRVLVQQRATSIVDGEPVDAWSDLTPAWQVAIEPATLQSLERITAGTVLSQASHIVTGRYRADITTGNRLIFNGRILSVGGVRNPDERNIETICVCAEIVP